MKNFLFVLIFLPVTGMVAQEAPSAQVKNTFFKLYPKASDVDWELEDGHWEAEFDDAEGELEVLFTYNGDWVETVRELKCRALPASIKSKVKAEYPVHRLDEVERVWQSDFDGYRIEMENRKSEVILMVTPDGVITNVVVEDEDD